MGSINKDERKNNTIVITLIFFLIFLLISSIIIFSRFSINSKRVGTNLDKSVTDIKISKIEEEKSKEKEMVQSSTQKQEAQPQTQQPQVVQKPVVEQQPQQQLQQKNTTVQPSSQTKIQQAKSKSTTSKETKPANYVINAYNIKKYHNILLKEFENVTIVDYKVKWGDTLWKIALKYNTSAHSIYVYNAFNDPDLIIAGSIIKVPTNFVLSKTRTNTILLDLISKEKSGYNNSLYNNNFAFFKDLNSDNVLSNNYSIDNFINLIYNKDDYDIIIKDIILKQI